MDNIIVARQPIVDANFELHGYELLYRVIDGVNLSFVGDNPGDVSQEAATASVLVNVLGQLDIATITHNAQAFINIPFSLLHHNQYQFFPKHYVCFEVPYRYALTFEDRKTIAALTDSGYRVVLDNFTHCDPSGYDLLSHVSYVKLNAQAINHQELLEQLEILNAFPIKTIISRVETYEEFKKCEELGLDYFQGYFIDKPRNINQSNKPLSANQVTLMNIIAKLQDRNVSPEELQELFLQDSKLVYLLLRIINSAAFGISRKVSSIKEAIIFVGLDFIRSWASMIALAASDDRPIELIRLTIVRAKMCSTIAGQIGEHRYSEYFTVGMLSTMDAIFNRRMEEVLDELPLDNEIKSALTKYEGPMGAVLQNVLRYENGDFIELNTDALTFADYQKIYISSTIYADETCEILTTD